MEITLYSVHFRCELSPWKKEISHFQKTDELREQDIQLSKTFDLFKIDIYMKNLTI